MIPHIAHYIWIGGKPLPEEFQYYQEKFRRLHPGWNVCTWTEHNISPELLINKQSYLESSGIVQRADILKFELLWTFGGLFVDMDMEFYKNIEPYIENIDCFSCGEKEGLIGNAIIGATPRHPTIKKLIDGVPQSIEENKDYGPNITTGPLYCTKTLTRDDIHIFPPECFFPTPPGTVTPPDREDDYPNSIAHHKWAASWVGVEEKKDYNTWKVERREDARRYDL